MVVSRRKEFFLTLLIFLISFIPFAPLQNFNLFISFIIVYLFLFQQNKVLTFMVVLIILFIQLWVSYYVVLAESISNLVEVIILVEKPFYLMLYLGFFYTLMDKKKLDLNYLVIYYALAGIGTFLFWFSLESIHQLDALDLIFYQVDYKQVLENFYALNPQFNANEASIEKKIEEFGWAWHSIPVFIFLFNLAYFLLFLRLTNKKFFFLRLNFFYFQVPRYFLPIFIFLWIILLINYNYEFILADKLAVTQFILILISFCYFIRGYAVFRFLLGASQFWSKLSSFRKILLLTGFFLLELITGIVFLSFLMLILGVGFLDEWKNYRKI